MRYVMWVWVVAVVALASQPALAADPLPGKWNVTLTPDDARGPERPGAEVLVFQQSRFWAEGFRQRGFEPTVYESQTTPFGAGKFQASQKSSQQGTLQWSGTVVVQQMEGALTWTQADGREVHYSFKGSKL